ncbi:hypothetical protein JOD18_000121 [Gracilibacillus alcaliphilus]|nr:hypothetical protein [Gracilibacillus alcaliphilus]
MLLLDGEDTYFTLAKYHDKENHTDDIPHLFHFIYVLLQYIPTKLPFTVVTNSVEIAY